jgi:hypothetical protein
MEGKHSTLTDKQVAELEDLGFVWTMKKDAWEQHFSQLLDGWKINRNCKFLEPGMNKWIASQRLEYQLLQKGKKAKSQALPSNEWRN